MERLSILLELWQRMGMIVGNDLAPVLAYYLARKYKANQSDLEEQH